MQGYEKGYCIFFLLFFFLNLSAQRKGIDTLAGYIVTATHDTITGKLLLHYKMVKEKKELHKEYEKEQWHRKAVFIGEPDSVRTYTPADIIAYGWKWNDTSNVVFRSMDVVIPHKGAMLMKGGGYRFLRVEIAGPMNLYLYTHTENGLGATGTYNDRYLQNEKGEVQVLKIKTMLGIAYNLSTVESWFGNYPGLSKFKIKDMLSFEVWLLVAGYNDWKKN
jgi:hypothetical protein